MESSKYRLWIIPFKEFSRLRVNTDLSVNLEEVTQLLHTVYRLIMVITVKEF